MRITLSLLLVLILAACSNSTTSINLPPGSNGVKPDTIFSDGGFVSSDRPSLGVWRLTQKDSEQASQFIFDAPHNRADSINSIYSLFLYRMPTPQSVYTYFTNLSSGVYQLSVWAKDSAIGGGSFYMTHSAQPAWKKSVVVPVNNSVWKQLTLLDTLSLTDNDTLRIVLSGGEGASFQGMTCYNYATLVKLQ